MARHSRDGRKRSEFRAGIEPLEAKSLLTGTGPMGLDGVAALVMPASTPPAPGVTIWISEVKKGPDKVDAPPVGPPVTHKTYDIVLTKQSTANNARADVILYWAKGPRWEDRLFEPGNPKSFVEAGFSTFTVDGRSGTQTVNVAAKHKATEGATHLLAVLGPANHGPAFGERVTLNNPHVPYRFPTTSIVIKNGENKEVTDFAIGADAKMPTINASITLEDGSKPFMADGPVKWTVRVKFDNSKLRHGGPKRPDSIDTVELVEHHGSRDGTFSPDWDRLIRAAGRRGLFGGDLTLRADFKIDGKDTVIDTSKAGPEGLRIVGTNPTLGELHGYIDGRAAAMPTLRMAASLLKKMIKGESDNLQFLDKGPDAGQPKFNANGNNRRTKHDPSDKGLGDGGVGLKQISPVFNDDTEHYTEWPTNDHLWNWKANIDRGMQILVGKITVAKSWSSRIMGQDKFKKAVKATNAALRAVDQALINDANAKVDSTLKALRDQLRGALAPDAPLPEIDASQINVPRWTSNGDNYDGSGALDKVTAQVERDALRGYNGYAGKDWLGFPLREYVLASVKHGDTDVLKLTYNATTRRYDAEWKYVGPSEREAPFVIKGSKYPGQSDYPDWIMKQTI